ncbi:MAG: TatD family hydrolase [Bacteroidota bacterium]
MNDNEMIQGKGWGGLNPMYTSPALSIVSASLHLPPSAQSRTFAPMKPIDTHSHLYSNKFERDLDEVIARAKESLSAVFLPNIDLASVEAMHQLTAKAPEFFFPMMGLHPCDVKEGFEQTLDQLKSYLDDPAQTYYAIGETGLDLYWDKSTLPLQQEALKVQVNWAKDHQLPIVLHARNAIDETADLIESQLDERLSGIFHCFDGSVQQAERIISFNTFKIGIGGIVTYRKDVQAMVEATPLEAMVLETDSPYLPPEPHRKDKPRRNESSYTKYVCQKVAELKDVSYEEVARITNANAQAVFHTAPIAS